MTFTEEEINRIINLKDSEGKPLDVFSLGGVLYLDDGDDSKGSCRFTAHSLPICVDDFWACESEEDVLEQFHKSLKEIVLEKLF